MHYFCPSVFIFTGGYIFNTEAHPIDPAALRCCHNYQKEKDDLVDALQMFDQEEILPKAPLCSNDIEDKKFNSTLFNFYWNRTKECDNIMHCKQLPFHMKFTKEGQIFDDT